MLGLLVVDQDLEVVEVALAVVAPRAVEDLLDVGVVSLLLAHGVGAFGSWGSRSRELMRRKPAMRSCRVARGADGGGRRAWSRVKVVAAAWRSYKENDGRQLSQPRASGH